MTVTFCASRLSLENQILLINFYYIILFSVSIKNHRTQINFTA